MHTTFFHLKENSYLKIDYFAEVPGLVLSAATVDRFGRKLSMSAMLFISCAFLLPLVVEQKEAITTALLFGARICISGSFTICYVYAPEVSTRVSFEFKILLHCVSLRAADRKII